MIGNIWLWKLNGMGKSGPIFGMGWLATLM
jgi:hypothetical protein